MSRRPIANQVHFNSTATAVHASSPRVQSILNSNHYVRVQAKVANYLLNTLEEELTEKFISSHGSLEKQLEVLQNNESFNEKMNMMLLEMGDSVDSSGGDSSSQSSGSGFGSGFGEQKNKTDPFGQQRNNPFGGGSGSGSGGGGFIFGSNNSSFSAAAPVANNMFGSPGVSNIRVSTAFGNTHSGGGAFGQTPQFGRTSNDKDEEINNSFASFGSGSGGVDGGGGGGGGGGGVAVGGETIGFAPTTAQNNNFLSFTSSATPASSTTTSTSTTTDGTNKKLTAFGLSFGQTTTTQPVSTNEKKKEEGGAKNQTAFSFGGGNSSGIMFGGGGGRGGGGFGTTSSTAFGNTNSGGGAFGSPFSSTLSTANLFGTTTATTTTTGTTPNGGLSFNFCLPSELKEQKEQEMKKQKEQEMKEQKERLQMLKEDQRRKVRMKKLIKDTAGPLQNLPGFMRRQIFHCLSYKDYLRITPSCEYMRDDWKYSLKYNLFPDCLFFPSDQCKTINEAYASIEQSNGALTTIVLGPGDHVVEGSNDGTRNYLEIKCPVNIVGSRDVLDKSKIVVVGGFRITANGAHVEHLTIRHESGHGVCGESSCTLTDLMIDQCRYGVCARGSDAVFNCLNIMVSKCQWSGVCADYGGTIILRGTRIAH